MNVPSGVSGSKRPPRGRHTRTGRNSQQSSSSIEARSNSQTHVATASAGTDPAGLVQCQIWAQHGGCPNGNGCLLAHGTQAGEHARLRAQKTRNEGSKGGARQGARGGRNSHTEQLKSIVHAQDRPTRYPDAASLATKQQEQDDLARKRRTMEEARATERSIINSTGVTFSAGLGVEQILSGFASSWMKIGNLPPNPDIEELYSWLSAREINCPAAYISSVNTFYRNGCSQSEVDVLCNKDAKRILSNNHDMEYRGSPVFIGLESTALDGMPASTDQANELVIMWHEPSFAVTASFPDVSTARRQANALNGKLLGGKKVRVEMSRPDRDRYLPGVNHDKAIKIRGIPLEADMNEIQTFSRSEKLISHSWSNFDAEDSFRQLQIYLEAFGLHGFQRNPQQPFDTKLKVTARFGTWDGAKKASHALGQRPPPLDFFGDNSGFLLFLSSLYQYEMPIDSEQYAVQKHQWDELQEESRGNSFCSLRTRIAKSGRVYVKVGGNDMRTVGILKVRAESLAAGDKVERWNPSLARSSDLRKIASDTGTFIRGDFKNKVFRIFGRPADVEIGKRRLEKEITRLDAMEFTTTLPPGAFNFFSRREGLVKLKGALGDDNVKLNVSCTPFTVTFTGGDTAKHLVQTLIQEASASPQKDIAKTADTYCPICNDAISFPVTLGCDHIYCIGCIRRLLVSAIEARRFPIVCLGAQDRCKAPMSIPIIRRLLTQQEYSKLQESALASYIVKNPRAYRYCPTPDCQQVYPLRLRGEQPLQCPSCFFLVCPSCGEESHYQNGMSCEDVKRWKRVDDSQVDHWAQENDAKRCPACSILIQKTSGCNHMTCGECATHFCWVCLAFCPPENISAHIREAHRELFAHLMRTEIEDTQPSQPRFTEHQAYPNPPPPYSSTPFVNAASSGYSSTVRRRNAEEITAQRRRETQELQADETKRRSELMIAAMRCKRAEALAEQRRVLEEERLAEEYERNRSRRIEEAYYEDIRRVHEYNIRQKRDADDAARQTASTSQSVHPGHTTTCGCLSTVHNHHPSQPSGRSAALIPASSSKEPRSWLQWFGGIFGL